MREVGVRILHSLGYTVLEARDGPQALGLLRERPAVDLLLTDVVLPKLGGRRVAEQAKAMQPGLRVLFTSGYTDDLTLQHQLVERGATMLQKPFTPGSLARKVREVLDRPSPA